MNQANRGFDDAEARNAGNPAYQPYPKGAHRHLGLIAEAVLAERAAMRQAVASAMAPPGTDPESAERDLDYRADAGRGACRGDRPGYRSHPRARPRRTRRKGHPVTENEPRGRQPARGAPGTSRTGNAVARRGDLVVIHLRHRDWKDGQPREYDDFWLGQVTSVTRAGLVRLYRPAGTFAWDTDGRGRPTGASRCRPCGSSAPRSRARRRSTSPVPSPRRPATPGRATRVTSAATPPLRKSGRRCVRTCWTSPAGNGSATLLATGRPPGGKPARC